MKKEHCMVREKSLLADLKSVSRLFCRDKKICFIYTYPQYHKSVFWNLPIQGKDL